MTQQERLSHVPGIPSLVSAKTPIMATLAAGPPTKTRMLTGHSSTGVTSIQSAPTISMVKMDKVSQVSEATVNRLTKIGRKLARSRLIMTTIHSMSAGSTRKSLIDRTTSLAKAKAANQDNSATLTSL